MCIPKTLLIIGILSIAIPSYAISYSLGGSTEIRETIEQDGSTPHEKTLTRIRLRGNIDLTTWLRCKGEILAANRGGISQHSRPNLEQQWNTFQRANPLFEFEEAYCELSQPRWNIAVGKQKFAWGKLDSYQPNDLLNSERLTDPFLDDENERKIGSPAVSINLYPTSWLPEETKFTFVWEPLYTPAHFPYPDKRWFPPAANVGDYVSIPSGTIILPDRTYAPGFSVPMHNNITNDSQSFRFDRSTWAMRASTLIGAADTALYYFHGIDPQPTFELDTVVRGVPDQSASPLGIKNLSAITTLRPSFHVIDSFGADIAYPLGDFTFRAEGAYIRGRAFNRDLSSVLTSRETTSSFGLITTALQHGAGSVAIPATSYILSDVIEWGVGGDFVRNNGIVLLQINQSALLSSSATGLLIPRIDTRLLATLQKDWPDYGITTKLNLLHGIENSYIVMLPRVAYSVWSDLKLEVGYLKIAGRKSSIIGQYNDRDQVFVRALYSF